ncbi:unannotated protein [freshwater metagenome]|uniref:Unannotated protein n=1 Tax=freshwater metagenome TaxID=449393 RepID=A0A6J7N702_9ZZZZ
MEIERLFQPFGLPHIGMHRRAMVKRVNSPFDTFGILVNEKIETLFSDELIAELIHGPELPCRIDMEQLKRRQRRGKRFESKVQHHRTVFTDRIEHDRSFTFGNGFTKDLDALGLEALKMGKRRHSETFFGVRRS